MNNDGYGQNGAGDSDMRVGGEDLQHARQKRTASEYHEPVRIVRQSSGQGGPMKEMMNEEMNRHKDGAKQRLDHLENHYKR